MRAELMLDHCVQRIEGPLLFLERKVEVGLNAHVEVLDRDGRERIGRVAALDEQTMVIEVLESTIGLGVGDTRVRVWNEPLLFGVGPDMLGRTYDSIGQPTDGGAPIAAARRMRIDGLAINPAARALPRDFIETGISAIDLMNSLVRGQKLPLFSGAGLPHDRLATDIVLQARLRARDARLVRGRVRRHGDLARHRRDRSAARWPRAARSSTWRCSSISRTSRRPNVC